MYINPDPLINQIGIQILLIKCCAPKVLNHVFAPGHLTEHMASAAPVLVFFKVVDGKLVVYRLEDAG